MTIGRRVTLYCGVSLTLVIGIGINSFVTIHSLDLTMHALADHSLPAAYSIGRLSGIAKDIRGNIRGHITSKTSEEKATAEKDLLKLGQALNEAGQAYQRTLPNAAARNKFERIPPLFRVLVSTASPIQPLSRQAKSREAMALFRSTTMPAFVEVQRAIDELAAFEKQQANQDAHSASVAVETGRYWAFALFLLSVTACSGIGWYIVRGITDVLRRSVAGLKEASSQTASAAHQVSASSQSLAEGASQQAAAIQETSALTEEIGSMTRSHAERSQQAAELMAEASKRGDEADRTLAEMVAAMNELNASSSRISQIIQVIDGIAFQTNILALNAAVEAARAGEAGSGFAVVADEVRNLARRSAQAAQDTEALIEDSIAKADGGKKRLAHVTASVRSVIESVATVKALVDEMKVGGEEQARGIEQVAKAISQIEHVTQKTAANAEQNAAAGEQLGAQSESMCAVVNELSALC